jgi:hypothetical protein
LTKSVCYFRQQFTEYGSARRPDTQRIESDENQQFSFIACA